MFFYFTDSFSSAHSDQGSGVVLSQVIKQRSARLQRFLNQRIRQTGKRQEGRLLRLPMDHCVQVRSRCKKVITGHRNFQIRKKIKTFFLLSGNVLQIESGELAKKHEIMLVTLRAALHHHHHHYYRQLHYNHRHHTALPLPPTPSTTH
ncbi:hypothetical protein E2C01_059500 [Portunus trituberculatus]|uniref:Uncharacterized protein n=1 Tax=Portunus trituberculatus TaxID=210409 RepID=A0A5B7H610_PORTR|nr:hypothetical protein [Portunus trituberculatus]